jgi:hypothetical protein
MSRVELEKTRQPCVITEMMVNPRMSWEYAVAACKYRKVKEKPLCSHPNVVIRNNFIHCEALMVGTERELAQFVTSHKS